jgi:Immunoglobulin I-set domain
LILRSRTKYLDEKSENLNPRSRVYWRFCLAWESVFDRVHAIHSLLIIRIYIHSYIHSLVYLCCRISEITDYVLVEPGDSAVFECIFTANPVMYDGIRWYGPKQHKQSDDDQDDDDGDAEDEDEQELGGGEGRVVTDWEEMAGGGVRARLLIRNVTAGDSGRIHCAVGNGIGEPVRRASFLLVKGKSFLTGRLIFRFYTNSFCPLCSTVY